MRNQARALVLVVLSLVTAVVLGIASVFVSALALGATALIVPGTGTPNSDVVAGYRENAWNRYIDGIVCTDPGECSDPDLVGIPYPASFWPLSFLPGWCVPGRCEKWNVSVDEGTENLLAALAPFLAPDSAEKVFIFGYSQGGAVVANALTELVDLSDEVKSRLNVVTIGGIENPDGGMWQRLAWLRYLLGDPVPILDVSFDPAMPTDTGIPTTTIGFEYDPVVYAPLYWGNPFAIANMIAAFDTVHGYYLAPNQNNDNPMPYGYTDATLAPQLDCGLNPANCRYDDFGNTYVMIPATSLPLTDLIRSLTDSLGIGWLAKPFIDLAEPVLREFVDLGFDWSGDPGVSRGLSVLPFKIFQNWLKVGVDLAVAAVKGVEAFIKNFIPGQAASLDRSRPAESPGGETLAPDTDVNAADAAEAAATQGEDAAAVEEDAVTPVAEDVTQDAAEDVTQDAAEDVTQDAGEDVTEDVTEAVTEEEVTVDDGDFASETPEAEETDTDADSSTDEDADTGVDTPAAA